MGTAMARAACKGGEPKDYLVCDVMEEKASALAQELGCDYSGDNCSAVRTAQYITFCVKPQVLPGILEDMAPAFQQLDRAEFETIVVSVVSGVECDTYRTILGIEDLPVMLMLPNTACLIGKGYTLVSEDGGYTPQRYQELCQILRESGEFDSIPHRQFTAGAVLTSTASAFIAMYANSLVDGGVVNGLFRPQARRFALKGIETTVQLLLESEKHLEHLKDDVCSPGGPGIIGVAALERTGFRSSIIDSVVTAYQRFAEYGKV